MKKYIGYLNSISVDTEQHELIMKRLNRKAAPFHRNRVVFRFAEAVACALTLILCIFTIPGLFDKPVVNYPYDPNNTAIIGLPIENFNLANLHNPGGEAESRIAIFKMSDFFSYGKPYFVFARVIGTEEWTDKSSFGNPQKQTSTVHILSTLWSETELPETISVIQSNRGGCCADEKTNLLRNGRVYLLPITYRESSDQWTVWGDLDVLFEVDDQGRIWSHSQHGGFSRFDGQDTSIVTNIITAMTTDENFTAVITPFGYIANNWGVLAEVTVLSVSGNHDQWGHDQTKYSMTADTVLSTSSNPHYTWRAENGSEITVISHGNSEYLKQGERYLLLLDPSDGGPYIEQGNIAKIIDDGTIFAIPSTDQVNSIFTEFNGFTVAQMKEEAEHAKAWHEAYAK